MKYLSPVTLILAVMVGTAQADIFTDFELVTPDSGHGEFSANLDDAPANTNSSAIMVRTGVDAKWLGTLLEVELTDGSLFYHEFGNPDLSPPNPAFFALFPELRYTTQVFAPDGVNPGIVPNPIFQDQDAVAEPPHLVSGWFEGDPGRDGAVPGHWQVGLLTMTKDSQGVLRGISTDEDSAGGGITFAYPIVDGNVIIPEPTTFVLALLATLGLSFYRQRRRRRRRA